MTSPIWMMDGHAAAVARFKKELYERINHEWLIRVNAQETKLKAGRVRVWITLANTGQVRDIRILSSDSGERLNKLIVEAIKNTTIPAPPLLTQEKEVGIDLTFRLVKN